LKTRAIKNCEVKPKDLENAIAIGGNNVAELKGKTIWKKLAPVISDIMKVPRDLLKLEKDVSMCLDIFFINKIPFLITLSLRIYFTTVLNLKNQKMKTVVALAKHIYVCYFHCSFSDHGSKSLNCVPSLLPGKQRSQSRQLASQLKPRVSLECSQDPASIIVRCWKRRHGHA
jgi:hypothetical protein